MKNIKYLFLIPLLSSQLLFAEEKTPTVFMNGGKNSLIATLDNFAIQINDNITGGCLPQPSKLKDKLEIKLRKNGFKIIKDPKKASKDIYIDLIGYKIGNSSCVVHVSATLRKLSLVRVPYAPENDNLTITTINHTIGSHLMTGDRYSMQRRLEKQVEEYGDTLYLDISRAKDDTFSKFPSIKKRYEESKK